MLIFIFTINAARWIEIIYLTNSMEGGIFLKKNSIESYKGARWVWRR